MQFIRYEVHSGEYNMRIDSELLENAIANNSSEPVFRLYGWSPKCISLGRNQGVGAGVNIGINNADVDVVRRVTGGRALLHDNEITYSCVFPISLVPEGENIKASYKYISGILIDFFKTLGLELDFGENKKISTKFDYCMLVSTGADVCYKGKKLIGSAQYRKQGYILQHGSILYDYDKAFLEELFHEKVSGITCIKEVLPDITKDDLIVRLEDYISKL